MDRLDEQRNGFIKEAKRYSRKKDKQNELKAKAAALELSYAKDQINKLKDELKNQFKSKQVMDQREILNKKYENYERKNTFFGWMKHIYLVFLSLLTEKKYYK